MWGRASVRSQGRVLAQDQVLGHVVGDDERAPPGLGDGQAQGRAGAQCFPDHGAAHAVLLGKRGLGAQLGADAELAGFDFGRGGH